MEARPTQEELSDLISAGPGLYGLLTVDKKATQEEIKKRYRSLAKKHHPDKAGSPDSPTTTGSNSSSMMVDINRAYHILSNPRLRSLYDTLGLNSPNCSLYKQQQQGGGGGGRSSRGSRNREEYYQDVYGNYQRNESQSGGGGYQGDDDAYGDMGFTFASMLAHAAITPLKTIALIVQSSLDAKTNIWSAAKTRVKLYGFKSLWHGCFWSLSSIAFAEFLSTKFISSFPRTFYKSQLLQVLTKLAIEYPFELVMNLYMILGKNSDPWDLCQDMIYHRGHIGVLWTGFVPYVASTYASMFVDYGIQKFAYHARDTYLRNPKSKAWRYTDYFLSNTLVRTLLYTLVTTPMMVILYQTQIMAISNQADQLPFLEMIKSIFKTGGFFKFYAGILPQTIFLALSEKLSSLE
eukprot:gene190-228_t